MTNAPEMTSPSHRTLGFAADKSILARRAAPAWLLMTALLLPSLVTYIYFVVLHQQSSVVQQTSYVIGKGLQFALPAFWCFVVLRQPLRLRWRWAGVPSGIAFGLVIAGAMWCLFTFVLEPRGIFDTPAQALREKLLGWGVTNPLRFLLLTAFYSLVHSALEEYYWRWFVYRHLALRLPDKIANPLSGLGFMAHHVIVLGTYFSWSSPFTYLFSLSVAIGGCYWAWLYRRTGSLLAPWLSHMLIDAGIFLVGYSMIR